MKLLSDGIHAFKSLLSCEEINKLATHIPKNNPLRVKKLQLCSQVELVKGYLGNEIKNRPQG